MHRSEFWLNPNSQLPLFAVRYLPNQLAVGAVGIVHGLGDHSGRFESMAAFLAERGFEVVCYDQRGHGRTGKSMPTFQTLVEDVNFLIDELQQKSLPTFLFGQSLGGGIVIHHALRQSPNVDGVIAGSPLLRPAQKPPFWKIFIGRSLGKLLPKLCLHTGLDPRDLSHDPLTVDAYIQDPLVKRYVSAALGISMLDAGIWSLENASKLKTPLLIMHGSEDRITSPRASEQFAQSIPNICELKIWPGLFHDLHHEIHRNDVLNFLVFWMMRQTQNKKPIN